MTFNPKWIIGKTVERVEMNPFGMSHDLKEPIHDPRIYFTDGSMIGFGCEEADEGDPGTGIFYVGAP
jgi:hypothetical protein